MSGATPAAAAPDLGAVPTFPTVDLPLSAWRDGLVVRMPNWLGDTVMALPALLQLRRLVPECGGLFVVCAPGLADLFAALPIVDQTIALGAAHRAWRRIDLTRLARTRAGLGLLCNNSLRDAIAFRLAGVPRLFGAAARGRSLLLTRAFRFPPRRDRELHGLHHAGRYLAMAYALGAPPWPGDFPEFRPAVEPETTPTEILAALALPRLLAVAPGAAYGDAKRWPEEHFLAVCQAWIGDGGTVALLGAKGETEVAARIAAQLPPDQVANLAGRTGLGHLIRLLAHADACLANDSGVMHLAAAMGRPGVAVFGSTDPSATGPLSPRWTVLHRQEPCSPCFRRTCPLGTTACLRNLAPDDAITALRQAATAPAPRPAQPQPLASHATP